jgi:hypothetical protein
MLIARGYTLTQIQQRLGHRKPDTTLKIYVHQWNYHAAQQSRIGHDLGTLITASRARVTRNSRRLAVVTGTSSLRVSCTTRNCSSCSPSSSPGAPARRHARNAEGRSPSVRVDLIVLAGVGT